MSFTIKVRGAGGFMMAEYACPRHGRFEQLVERDAAGDPPSSVACPAVCGELAPWTISAPPVHTQFVITATQGKSDPKPHRDAMDTRPLAEGRKNEWRKARKKLREERRHARVKELLR